MTSDPETPTFKELCAAARTPDASDRLRPRAPLCRNIRKLKAALTPGPAHFWATPQFDLFAEKIGAGTPCAGPQSGPPFRPERPAR